VNLQRGVLRAAELAGLRWVETEPLTLAGLRGGVVLIHFWDYACINCLRALPYLKVWHGRYEDRGLEILGIQAPEFEFGRDYENVRHAVEELGIGFRVAIDPQLRTWDAYANRFWPATYLIDGEGFLAGCHFGEGGYQEMETAIQVLLREVNPRAVLPRVFEPLRPEDVSGVTHRAATPDIYFGYRRGRIGNEEGFSRSAPGTYVMPADRMKDVYYLDGRFRSLEDCQVHEGDGPARISISYDAVDVYVVASPDPDSDLPATFVLEQDGNPLDEDRVGEDVRFDGNVPYVEVIRPRLLHLVSNVRSGRHEIVLSTESPGLRLHGFSFLSAT
jgi:thiol-disulfide isomerase/thioredoxin